MVACLSDAAYKTGCNNELAGTSSVFLQVPSWLLLIHAKHGATHNKLMMPNDPPTFKKVGSTLPVWVFLLWLAAMSSCSQETADLMPAGRANGSAANQHAVELNALIYLSPRNKVPAQTIIIATFSGISNPWHSLITKLHARFVLETDDNCSPPPRSTLRVIPTQRLRFIEDSPSDDISGVTKTATLSSC